MRNHRFKHELITTRELAPRYALLSDCTGTLSWCPRSGASQIPSRGPGVDGRQIVAHTETKPGADFDRTRPAARPRCCTGLGFNDVFPCHHARQAMWSIDQDLGLFARKGCSTTPARIRQVMARYEPGRLRRRS